MRRVALLVLALAAFVAAPAAVAAPSIALSAHEVRVGDTILVTLNGWPSTTTVSVCGNNGTSGAADCDLVGAVGVPATPISADNRQLIVTAPPTACPCVVRAATAREALVRTIPITIDGMPARPRVLARVDAAAPLVAKARLVPARESLFDRLRAWIGGRSHRSLRLLLRNTSSSPISGVSVNAAVGRSSDSGAPLQSPEVRTLAPGASQTLQLDVALSAPSFGAYRVYGTVYGPGTAQTFDLRTHTTPWGLLVLGVVGLVDLAWLLRRRYLLFR